VHAACIGNPTQWEPETRAQSSTAPREGNTCPHLADVLHPVEHVASLQAHVAAWPLVLHLHLRMLQGFKASTLPACCCDCLKPVADSAALLLTVKTVTGSNTNALDQLKQPY
jgi:hypothetical protein